MSTKEITARDLRMHQGDVLDEVAFQRVQYIVTRHGKQSVVMISPEDFQFLQKAWEFFEDEMDAREGEAAYEEFLKIGSKSKAFEEVMKELEIDL